MGKEQLLASKSLLENEFYRDSITLAYFSMHSSAKALLLKRGISPKTHEGTLRQLAKEYVKEGLFSKESYNYLDYARTMRNKSSYACGIVFSEDLAREIISHAEKFLDEVEQLL